MFLAQSNGDVKPLKNVDALDHLKSLLKDLKHQKKNMISSQEIHESSQEQIDGFFKRIYQASLMSEKRLQQIQVEKDALNHTMDSIWKNLESLIGPLWKIEEPMFQIYEKLAAVYKEILILSKQPFLESEKRLDEIRKIQEELDEIENKFRVDGKFGLGGEKDVRGGQAVITALIERCFRLIHHLILQVPEVDPALMEYKEKVERIISDLNLMASQAQVDRNELIQLQVELDEVDSQQKDSKFLDSFGNIPVGQAHLRALIERAYDLVNDIQLKIEAREVDGEYFVKVIKESIQEIEDRLQESTTSILSLSKSKIRDINEQLSRTIGHLKEWLLNPKEGLAKISSTAASVHRSGMSVLSRVYAELEPVSEELMPIQNQLNTIRSSLLDIRNQFNRIDLNTTVQKAAIKDLKENVESIHSELESLDKQRVEGNFLSSSGKIKSGQDHLRSVMNECYCLIFELIDRLSVVDF